MLILLNPSSARFVFPIQALADSEIVQTWEQTNLILPCQEVVSGYLTAAQQNGGRLLQAGALNTAASQPVLNVMPSLLPFNPAAIGASIGSRMPTILL